MASTRRQQPPLPETDAQELTAVLDELEVRFLLDPDTTFEDERRGEN